MAVLPENGDRAPRCSSPSCWNMLDQATRSPSHWRSHMARPFPQLLRYVLHSPKMINAVVSQGSKGSASPRHVFAFEGSRAAAAG